jgi:hypothetical protein
MTNQVKTPIQNYFEKVLYENLTFEIPPLWVLELHCQSRDGQNRNITNKTVIVCKVFKSLYSSCDRKQIVMQTVEKGVLLHKKTLQPFLSMFYTILYYIDTEICSLEVIQNSILIGPFGLSTLRTIVPQGIMKVLLDTILVT